MDGKEKGVGEKGRRGEVQITSKEPDTEEVDEEGRFVNNTISWHDHIMDGGRCETYRYGSRERKGGLWDASLIASSALPGAVVAAFEHPSVMKVGE